MEEEDEKILGYCKWKQQITEQMEKNLKEKGDLL